MGNNKRWRKRRGDGLVAWRESKKAKMSSDIEQNENVSDHFECWAAGAMQTARMMDMPSSDGMRRYVFDYMYQWQSHLTVGPAGRDAKQPHRTEPVPTSVVPVVL